MNLIIYMMDLILFHLFHYTDGFSQPHVAGRRTINKQSLLEACDVICMWDPMIVDIDLNGTHSNNDS